MNNKKIKKILIFKLCCLGDIVFLTPVINELKKKYPDAQIIMLTTSWINELLQYLVHCDKSIIYDAPYTKGRIKKVSETIKLILRLRKENIDLAFLGHRNSIFGFILWLAGIKYRLGFEGTKFINYAKIFDDKLHETKRYLKVLETIDIFEPGSKTELIQKKNKSDLKKGIYPEDNKLTVGFFPFGGSNPGTEMDIKRWYLKNYNEVIRELSWNKNLRIILFEGKLKGEQYPEDKYWKELPENVIRLKLSFDLISLCNIFISGDTGPIHIAAAFGVTTYTIFGPSDPGLVAPLSEGRTTTNSYIWKQPSCSPCYTPKTAIDTKNEKYWRDECFICYTGTHICMKMITVPEVINDINKIINSIK
jgi:ADP-heptose:LPS heptosyltransferase